MPELETDYLVIGSGAVGLAFADTLLTETDAQVTIIDRHAKPGGHWNDAYAFVALHQPSAYYGVNSTMLGDGRKDTLGINKGLYELASGPEVCGYFDKVMNQVLLPSGRVRYFPMCDYQGDGQFRSLMSGNVQHVKVRKKIVDATYYGTTVPATHKPKFAIGEGVRVVPPNALVHLWQDPAAIPKTFVVVGAGKTAMDAVVWLLNAGTLPDAIHWVMPRDSWLLNRLKTQPGDEFFMETIGGQAALMEALGNAATIDDLFLRLEAAGVMLRIYPDQMPTMFHFATMSTGEVEVLCQIKNVIRRGRAKSVDQTGVTFEDGHVAFEADTLYVDCTATAVTPRPLVPVFDGDKITLQMIRLPQPAFSAALVGYVEAHFDDDVTKNLLCAPIPLPDGVEGYPATQLGNMMNQFQWNQHPGLRDWIKTSRLDGFAKVIAAVDPADEAKIAVLKAFRTHAGAAMANIQNLIASTKT